MLIVSKFHDYYDTSMGMHGIDKSIVYKRHIKEFKYEYSGRGDWDKKFSIFDKFGSNHNLNIMTYSENDLGIFFVVGFCGKLYLGYKYEYKVNCQFGEKTKYNFYYGEEILNFFDSYYKKKYKKISLYEKRRLKSKRLDVANYINEIHKIDYIDPFRHHNVPIFVEVGHTLILNDKLLNWNFGDMFKSYTAFQEIQMFLSGVLGSKEKDLIEIDDKYKIVQHGMNKWSFRNPDPPKRKMKNKK